MPNYDIDIRRLLMKDKDGVIKTEIRAKIIDRETGKIINKRIWWEDDDGFYHDGTPDLPIELRDAVDNAWIEKSRNW